MVKEPLEALALLCEKSNEILINPVRLVGDGHVYEKKVIEEYLLTHDTSPVTGEILKTKELVEETELRYASEQLLRLADMPLTDGLADTLRDEINKSLQQVIHENNAYINSTFSGSLFGNSLLKILISLNVECIFDAIFL